MEGFLHLPSRETHQNARKGGFRAGFSYSALTLWSPQISDFFEKHSLTLSSPLLTLPEPFSPFENDPPGPASAELGLHRHGSREFPFSQ